MTASKIRILVADENPLIRAGLRTLLTRQSKFDLVGETGETLKIPGLCLERKVQVLLLGLSLEKESLTECLQALIKSVKVLILADNNQQTRVSQLVAFGINGYVLMQDTPKVLAQAVNSIVEGGVWFSQAFLELLVRPELLHDKKTGLTPREQQVLTLISQGANNLEIASTLGLASQIVKNYISRLYEKLNVQSRAQAIVWAREGGLENAESNN